MVNVLADKLVVKMKDGMMGDEMMNKIKDVVTSDEMVNVLADKLAVKMKDVVMGDEMVNVLADKLVVKIEGAAISGTVHGAGAVSQSNNSGCCSGNHFNVSAPKPPPGAIDAALSCVSASANQLLPP